MICRYVFECEYDRRLIFHHSAELCIVDKKKMHCRNYCLTMSECMRVIIEIEHKRRYISPINVSFQMMTVSWTVRKNFFLRKKNAVFFHSSSNSSSNNNSQMAWNVYKRKQASKYSIPNSNDCEHRVNSIRMSADIWNICVSHRLATIYSLKYRKKTVSSERIQASTLQTNSHKN